METIIEKLKKPTPVVELEGKLNEAEETIKELEEENAEMQDTYIIPDITISTALGRIYIKNEKGNMQLQMEIDDFVEELKKKYG